MILRIHHVQVAIPVGGEDDARAFYEDVLGMRPVPKPAHLQHLGGMWFACADSPVQLHVGVQEPFRPAEKAHPALIVDDLDAVRGALEVAGLPVVVDTQLQGFERFYTADPFGNRIEILAEDHGTPDA